MIVSASAAKSQDVILFLENAIYFDIIPDRAINYVAVNATWSVSYWYKLSVYSYLYENTHMRGHCNFTMDNYPVVGCSVPSVQLNAGSEYLSTGTHVVEAYFYSQEPYNVPPSHACSFLPSSCFDDAYGYNILDNRPSGGTWPWQDTPPEWITFYDPVSPRTSVQESIMMILLTENKRTAPGTSRDYYMQFKTFIPFDNVTSIPGDVCSPIPGGGATSILYYSGDYRQFDYYGTHRAQELVWAVPLQSRLNSGMRSSASNVGTSSSYAQNGMVANGSSHTGYWIDYWNISTFDTLNDCSKRHRQGVGTISSYSWPQPIMQVNRTSANSVNVNMNGSTSNPIAPASWTGPIRWNISTSLTENTFNGGILLNYNVVGHHTCFPSMELWADHHKLWGMMVTDPGTLVPCLVALPVYPLSANGTKTYSTN